MYYIWTLPVTRPKALLPAMKPHFSMHGGGGREGEKKNISMLEPFFRPSTPFLFAPSAPLQTDSGACHLDIVTTDI